MEYKETITIGKRDKEFYDRILNTEPSCEEECFSESQTISLTAKFDNGYEMDVKICGVQYHEDETSNLPFTEAVLFKDGRQVTFTEPADDLFGQWELEADGHVFITDVVEA